MKNESLPPRIHPSYDSLWLRLIVVPSHGPPAAVGSDATPLRSASCRFQHHRSAGQPLNTAREDFQHAPFLLFETHSPSAIETAEEKDNNLDLNGLFCYSIMCAVMLLLYCMLLLLYCIILGWILSKVIQLTCQKVNGILFSKRNLFSHWNTFLSLIYFLLPMLLLIYISCCQCHICIMHKC